jgi:hypothetical protein
MRSLIRLLATFAILLPAATAQGESLPILDRALEFEPPEGYCLLDRSDMYESQIFDYMAELQRRNGTELLAMYAVCGETQAIIDGEATNYFNYGLLVALPSDGVTIQPMTGYSRAEVIDLLQLDMPSASAEIAAGLDSARQTLAESGIALTNATQPTVIGSDDNALYAAFSLEVDAGQGPAPVAAIAAFTFVKELPLVLHLYAPGDDGAFEALLDEQADLLANFVAANE